MEKVYTRLQTKTAQNPHLLGRHIPIWLIEGSTPEAESVKISLSHNSKLLIAWVKLTIPFNLGLFKCPCLSPNKGYNKVFIVTIHMALDTAQGSQPGQVLGVKRKWLWTKLHWEKRHVQWLYRVHEKKYAQTSTKPPRQGFCEKELLFLLYIFTLRRLLCFMKNDYLMLSANSFIYF